MLTAYPSPAAPPATELALPAPAVSASPSLPTIDLYSAVLSGRNARTVRAYEADYRDFAAFLGVAGPGQALDALISVPHGVANGMALGYRGHLTERGLAPATIARRLSALKSAVRLARQLGRVAWGLDIEAPKVQSYRDTAGPGRTGWRAMLDHAKGAATTPRGRRDLALVRLLHDTALRRAEAIGLDLDHVDLERGVIQVLGKGKTGRVPITLPPPTRAALADWIAARGDGPGPLFKRLDRGAEKGTGDGRLTGRGVHKIVGSLGKASGLSRPVKPHGLRHQAITQALDATGGNVRAVRKFSRHAKLDTLLIYDDSRVDLAGDVARQVAED
jgi:integrase/recombinase XerC